jgi:hypothetical protein
MIRCKDSNYSIIAYDRVIVARWSWLVPQSYVDHECFSKTIFVARSEDARKASSLMEVQHSRKTSKYNIGDQGFLGAETRIVVSGSGAAG